jgi:Predicted nucleotide kinase (related to CMP and AMP kinases)
MRTAPNVIVTGTPGVGKTVHCEQLAQDLGLKHLSVNQVAKDRDCYEEYDEERKSWVVDDDKVCCWIDFGVTLLRRAFFLFFFPARIALAGSNNLESPIALRRS